MIRLLREWKGADGHREVQVVGGDVHVGGHTDVLHHGTTVFRQLITSPVTNKPPRWWDFHALRALLETNQRLSESYRFEHHDFTSKRNYGMLVMRASDGRAPTVRAGLECEP